MNYIERVFINNFPWVLAHRKIFLLRARWTYLLKHRVMLNYIKREYKDLINEYKQISPLPLENISDDCPIWIMWYQGEDEMPSISKAAINYTKAHTGNHPIIFLTKDNIRQYVSASPIWDDVIFEYVEQEKIIKAHFADLCRVCLLYTYGGVWLDSTLKLNTDIDNLIKGLPFTSGKRKDVVVSDADSFTEGKWITYFIASSKGNLMLKFIFEVLLAQLKKEGRFIDYFMLDYSFVTAYNEIPYVKKIVDPVPALPNRFRDLMIRINDEFSQTEYDRLCSEMPFYKMSYKPKLEKYTKDGKLTYYGYFIKDVDNSIKKK